MPEPRELPRLAPIEAIAVLVIAVAPWPERLPVALPLLVAATVARYVRRRTWADVAHGPAAGWQLLGGALAGAVALGLAVVLTPRGLAALSQRSFEWTEVAVASGDPSQLAIVALTIAVMALATELALRGWIVERVLELSPGSPVLPIAVGALVEALVTPGDGATRLGAAFIGAGLGAMYVAAGRSVLAPVCARIAFQGGAVLLEGLR